MFDGCKLLLVEFKFIVVLFVLWCEVIREEFGIGLLGRVLVDGVKWFKVVVEILVVV